MEIGSAKDWVDEANLIEPTRLEELPEAIVDVVAELSAATAILGTVLHPTTAATLKALVRIMNTYYSNLIEGNDTKPRDIERALAGDFDHDRKRGILQFESAAYVRLETEIDFMAAEGLLPEPASAQFIQWLHTQLYRDAPAETLRIRSDSTQFVMEPGRWRRLPLPAHSVGGVHHYPPDSARVDDLMRHFEMRYRFANMGKGARIIALAAAHHRFNYISPFPTGNGRISRLISHAMALKSGIGAQGLWSISRGLALGLESRGDYRTMMGHADTPRQGNIDGRGDLSQRALREFVLWFLKVCLDQANFMSTLFDPHNLSGRLGNYVDRSEILNPKASKLLHEAMKFGQFERGEASRITGLPERSARRVLNDLISQGLLASPTAKTPVSLRFPTVTIDNLFPRLYSEA
jgi:Fic family protein